MRGFIKKLLTPTYSVFELLSYAAIITSLIASGLPFISWMVLLSLSWLAVIYINAILLCVIEEVEKHNEE